MATEYPVLTLGELPLYGDESYQDAPVADFDSSRAGGVKAFAQGMGLDSQSTTADGGSVAGMDWESQSRATADAALTSKSAMGDGKSLWTAWADRKASDGSGPSDFGFLLGSFPVDKSSTASEGTPMSEADGTSKVSAGCIPMAQDAALAGQDAVMAGKDVEYPTAPAQKRRRSLSVSQTPRLPLGNPLGFRSQFPPYAQIKAEHVVPGMECLLACGYMGLEALENRVQSELESGKLTYEIVIREYEALLELSGSSWTAVEHLKSVCDSEELRDAVEEIQPKEVELELRVQQSETLYKAWEYLLSPQVRASLSASQVRVVEIRLRDARLSGVALKGKSKARFNEIQTRLSKLQSDFGNNKLDATKAVNFRLTSKLDVQGIPPSALALAAQAAREKEIDPQDSEASAEEGPWVFTLDDPSYGPVMSHCKNRELRRKMQRAASTRASHLEALTKENSTASAREELAEKPRDNAPAIREMLQLRQEAANLLGYKNYAEVSLASKMATLEEALQLLEKVRTVAYQLSLQELKELETFAKEMDFPKEENLQSWDIGYYAERLSEARFKFTEEELKPFFALPRVQEGLWMLARKLFGVIVQRVSSPDLSRMEVSLWHPDVELYAVTDPVATGSAPIAYFYFDPYVRPETKEGGAWMGEVRNRSMNPKLLDPGSGRRIPVGVICCNQTPPIPASGTPSLMTLEDVETLFHEFGHMLQHVLTEENEGLVSGTSGVEWDAIEQPSQFMENWVYDRTTVTSMAIHYETLEPLPNELFEKILKARTFHQGLGTLAYLHKSLLDLKLHMDYDVSQPVDCLFKEESALSALTTIMPRDDWDCSICSFDHAFAADDYAAGYWNYLWAEVLSADCFAAFEEVGLENLAEVEKVGAWFRATILGLGGGEAPAEVFRRFRGRNPSPAALLRHRGLS